LKIGMLCRSIAVDGWNYMVAILVLELGSRPLRLRWETAAPSARGSFSAPDKARLSRGTALCGAPAEAAERAIGVTQAEAVAGRGVCGFTTARAARSIIGRSRGCSSVG
jgi:hypothetical protein